MIPFEPLRDTVLFLAAHLASFGVIVASAWIFGETVMRGFAIDCASKRWAVAGTLGWGLIAQSMFLLGALGLFERWVVLGLLILGHLLCFRTWRSAISHWRPSLTVAIAGSTALPFFALALYPPTGFDATVYHLPYAHSFVEAGGLEFLPDLRFPVFPQVGEMGFVLGFFLSGEVAAKLTQVLAILLTAGLLLDWGRLHGSRAGIWAAALWLGNPLIVWLGASAYIDATLALFVTASLYTWERWVRDGNHRWLWLAGSFAGLAAGTKYLGLFFLAALGLLAMLRALKPGYAKSRDIRPLLTLSAIALVVLAPWYLRIVYHTGNPVFPFYTPLFGESAWASLHDQALPKVAAETGTNALWAVVSRQGTRIAEGLSFLVKVPWTAIFDRGVFHWQAPLSPYYLLLLPLCAPIALFKRSTRWLIVVITVYGLFWLTTVRDLRFLVACMPALNVALAATLDRSTLLANVLERQARQVRKLATPLLTMLLLAPGPLYAGYKIHEHGWPPVNPEQRAQYLIRQVTGFQAIAAMNELEGRDYTVYALYGEYLRYYADGRFLGDWFGPAKFSRIEAVLGDSRALASELKRLGACFFLLRHSRPHELVPADSYFQQHFQPHSTGDGFTLYRLPEIACSRNTAHGT